MIESGDANFRPLLLQLVQVGAVYAIGVFSSWAYNRLMINVSQGTMRNLRIRL